MERIETISRAPEQQQEFTGFGLEVWGKIEAALNDELQREQLTAHDPDGSGNVTFNELDRREEVRVLIGEAKRLIVSNDEYMGLINGFKDGDNEDAKAIASAILEDFLSPHTEDEAPVAA